MNPQINNIFNKFFGKVADFLFNGPVEYFFFFSKPFYNFNIIQVDKKTHIYYIMWLIETKNNLRKNKIWFIILVCMKINFNVYILNIHLYKLHRADLMLLYVITIYNNNRYVWIFEKNLIPLNVSLCNAIVSLMSNFVIEYCMQSVVRSAKLCIYYYNMYETRVRE